MAFKNLYEYFPLRAFRFGLCNLYNKRTQLSLHSQ